jgi:hypothetical protein
LAVENQEDVLVLLESLLAMADQEVVAKKTLEQLR